MRRIKKTNGDQKKQQRMENNKEMERNETKKGTKRYQKGLKEKGKDTERQKGQKSSKRDMKL